MWTHLLRDEMIKSFRRWDGGEIERLRHFKSPDDWGAGTMDSLVLFCCETRATFGFSSSVCVFPKGRQKQKKGQAKKEKHH